MHVYTQQQVADSVGDYGETRLLASTWPTTSQSNSMRSAARCCFTVGLESPCAFRRRQAEHFDIGGDVRRFHLRQVEHSPALAPVRKPARRLVVSAPRIFVANIRGEEAEEPLGRLCVRKKHGRRICGERGHAARDVKGISSALILRNPDIFSFPAGDGPPGFESRRRRLHLRAYVAALDQLAQQFHRIPVGQLVPELDPDNRLQGSHGVGGMIRAPIEGRNRLDQGFRIVFFERAHKRMITFRILSAVLRR